jgi:hypothetical protein
MFKLHVFDYVEQFDDTRYIEIGTFPSMEAAEAFIFTVIDSKYGETAHYRLTDSNNNTFYLNPYFFANNEGWEPSCQVHPPQGLEQRWFPEADKLYFDAVQANWSYDLGS